MALVPSSTASPTVASSSTDPIPPTAQENATSQSTTPPTFQQQQQQQKIEKDVKEEVGDGTEYNTEFLNNFQDSDIADYIAKYNKYEADYVRRIKAKYFSKNAMNGGSIFDEETTIEDEIIKSSRWPCTKSFIEPVQSSEEQGSSSASVAETSTNVPNRKLQYPKAPLFGEISGHHPHAMYSLSTSIL